MSLKPASTRLRTSQTRLEYKVWRKCLCGEMFVKTSMAHTACSLKCKRDMALLTGAKPMKSRRKAVSVQELDHLKRVAALPCAECGIEGYSQAAHSNRQQDGKGLGIKADYRATFPLCCTRPGEIGCHVRHDQLIGMTREEADERTDRYIADTARRLE